jgi:hypothetical protein
MTMMIMMMMTLYSFCPEVDLLLKIVLLFCKLFLNHTADS